MRLREWDENIVGQLLIMAQEFTAESAYPLTFDADQAWETIWAIFNAENMDVIYVLADGEVAAAAVVSAERDYHKEAFGYLVKFYVRKPFRGYGLGRELLALVEGWFDEKNVVASFATATALVGADQVFINLFGKFNYRQLGPTLYKERISHG